LRRIPSLCRELLIVLSRLVADFRLRSRKQSFCHDSPPEPQPPALPITIWANPLLPLLFPRLFYLCIKTREEAPQQTTTHHLILNENASNS
jgi:hypothetical protein